MEVGTVEVVWQEPPSDRQRPGQYDEIIAVLKKHPGRWALISAKWKTNSPPNAFKQAGCESTARRNKTANGEAKSWSVYARCPISKANPARVPKPAEVEKAKVREAIQTGTALIPPPSIVPRAKQPGVRPANDMGMTKFLAERRARGAVDRPE